MAEEQQSPVISPHRDAIVDAVGSFYFFLSGFPYLPESAIITPSPEGWGEEHRANFITLGKGAAAADLLCHLPYIDNTDWQVNYDTKPINWIGDKVKRDIEHGFTLERACLEPAQQKIPDHVICLTEGALYGRWLLVDILAGTIVDYSTLGGPDEKISDEEKQAGFVWKKYSTMPVAEYFNEWKGKYQSLWCVPVPIREKGTRESKSGEVRWPWKLDDPGEEIRELQKIYNDHGWGTEDFRKEDCREALFEWGDEYSRKLMESWKRKHPRRIP